MIPSISHCFYQFLANEKIIGMDVLYLGKYDYSGDIFHCIYLAYLYENIPIWRTNYEILTDQFQLKNWRWMENIKWHYKIKTYVVNMHQVQINICVYTQNQKNTTILWQKEIIVSGEALPPLHLPYAFKACSCLLLHMVQGSISCLLSFPVSWNTKNRHRLISTRTMVQAQLLYFWFSR